MINALYLANTLIYKAKKFKIDITPMKLQKLIYFIYKKYLQLSGESLFSERFEAWQYGPVVISVYDEFKDFKSNHINSMYINNDNNILIVNEDSDNDFKESFNYVWEKYSEYNGIYLSKLTHKKNTAWYNAVRRNELLLSDEDIKNEEWFE